MDSENVLSTIVQLTIRKENVSKLNITVLVYINYIWIIILVKIRKTTECVYSFLSPVHGTYTYKYIHINKYFL